MTAERDEFSEVFGTIPAVQVRVCTNVIQQQLRLGGGL